MGERIYLNNDWNFTEEFVIGLLKRDYDAMKMQSIRIPHTCMETPFNYFDEHIYQMNSGYRKVIEAKEEWMGKQVLLTFDGVAHEAEVFLNGEKIGEHQCGYTAFVINISEELIYGLENVLVVRVNSKEDVNIPPFGFVVDYMTYGGIYRDVYLDIKNDVYIEDVFVKTILPENLAVLEKEIAQHRTFATICTQVTLNKNSENLFLKQSMRIWGKDGLQIEKDVYKEPVTLGETKISELQLTQYQVKNIALWDVVNPTLYEITTELIKDGEVIDINTVRFGFRKAEFKPDGFYLNGRKYKLRGLNRHQSYPYVGYAMPKYQQKKDAEILKSELGLNAVRTSHYPQSHYFMDRCDEIGLLVFTEMPGWQHIGDEEWKNQAVENVKEMILQYRNHTSIILWGVRINESQDDDEFYKRTNDAAHALDDSRPTGGVRANKRSNLLEDVYTYNDFIHDGKAKGCDSKKDVTSNMAKPYLVSEYNGHMFPTKSFDCEEHRLEHAMRHVNVLSAVCSEEDIAGSFGWCMFDYNTHKDFGSGDRICYHGVMDMFRNPKLAAAVYTSQSDETDFLEISSSMDIGEHPGCNRGDTYIFTNADSVRMYKNDLFIKEFYAKDSKFKNLKHGPILIDDFIGEQIEKNENYTKKQAEQISLALNTAAKNGVGNLPLSIKLIAAKTVLLYHMKPEDAVVLYNRYIGDWGGSVMAYHFEAVKNGTVVKTAHKEPMKAMHLHAQVDHTELLEEESYDVAGIRIQVMDENQNILTYYQEPVVLESEGPIEIIGPKIISLKGGMAGTYIKTTGQSGAAVLKIRTAQAPVVFIHFEIFHHYTKL